MWKNGTIMTIHRFYSCTAVDGTVRTSWSCVSCAIPAVQVVAVFVIATLFPRCAQFSNPEPAWQHLSGAWHETLSKWSNWTYGQTEVCTNKKRTYMKIWHTRNKLREKKKEIRLRKHWDVLNFINPLLLELYCIFYFNIFNKYYTRCTHLGRSVGHESKHLANKWSLINSFVIFKVLLWTMTYLQCNGFMAEHKLLNQLMNVSNNANLCQKQEHEYAYNKKAKRHQSQRMYTRLGGTPPPLYSPIFPTCPMVEQGNNVAC